MPTLRRSAAVPQCRRVTVLASSRRPTSRLRHLNPQHVLVDAAAQLQQASAPSGVSAASVASVLTGPARASQHRE